MKFQKVYYEPDVLEYPLGKELATAYAHLEWYVIENHNNIPEFRNQDNSQFAVMKQYLILGIRKTHKYTANHKTSDYLVPYTSSGCSAMCMYCYLVCNYNKCSYLRVFVNREYMLERLIAHSNRQNEPLVYEIGSNSDLLLENQVTGNLPWTIETFAAEGNGMLTFPTKFHTIDSLLHLNHQGKTLFRMSVNPREIIKNMEFGTSSLEKRISALNEMHAAGYPIGILIAPVIMVEDWQTLYRELLSVLRDKLTNGVKMNLPIEIIFMTYSYIHRMINAEAFPKAVDLYDKNRMTGRGRGRYCYKNQYRAIGEEFFRTEIPQYLPDASIAYIV